MGDVPRRLGGGTPGDLAGRLPEEPVPGAPFPASVTSLKFRGALSHREASLIAAHSRMGEVEITDDRTAAAIAVFRRTHQKATQMAKDLAHTMQADWDKLRACEEAAKAAAACKDRGLERWLKQEINVIRTCITSLQEQIRDLVSKVIPFHEESLRLFGVDSVTRVTMESLGPAGTADRQGHVIPGGVRRATDREYCSRPSSGKAFVEESGGSKLRCHPS
jgi:hypothetical protein